jgi:putative peptidoglycan lipid II flippase
MLIQPILLGSSNLITCVAQANKIFSYYAISPIFYNIGVIFGILFFYKNYGIYGLIYGVLLGAFFHFGTGFIYLIRHKVDINLKYFDFRFIREIFPIVAWRSIAFIVMSVKQFVLTVFAGFLGVGIISSFTFAFNLTNMAVQFFATSYSIAAFPMLSEYFERGEFEKLKNTIRSNISKLLGVSILFSVILFIFAKLIVSIIYNGDLRVLNMFYILIFSIPMLSIEQYYARAFMAMGKVKLVSIMQVISLFILCITLTVLYKNGSDYSMLAKGYLITITLQTFILIVISRFYKLF